MSRLAVLAAGVLILAVASTATLAQMPASQDDLQQSIQALKERNKDLERRLADLESKLGNSPDAKREQQDEIRAMVAEAMSQVKAQPAAGWLDNLKFTGDLRLRYEYRDVSGARKEDGGDADQDKRARFRLRFGFEKSWPDEDMMVAFRLASGANSDPTTTNQTFAGFQKYPIWIDQAYARWTPKCVPGLAVTAGKMPNPWETTDLVWDPDINEDGVWVRYNVPGLGPVTPFVGVGVFQLLATTGKSGDASMKAYDIGARWQISKDVKFTSAVTFYNYTNIDSALLNGALTSNNGSPIPSGGNTTVAGKYISNYSTIDFVNKLDFVAFNIPMNVFIDYAHNDDSDSITSDEHLSGVAVGFKVGQNKKKGDWSGWYVWKDLQADAVLAAFTESDFGWNTLTNRRGSQFGVAYNITDAMTAGVTIFITEPIIADPRPERLTVQADLVWKF